MKIKIDDIIVGKNWSRTFGVGDVTELSESMSTHGQITPIIIDADNNLVAGFRRLEAAKRLGWDEIEACVNDGDDKVINLIENMNRENLTLWEEIQAVRDVFGPETSKSEIARQLSKTRPWVRPRVEIWTLPPEVIDKVRLGLYGVKEIMQHLRQRDGGDSSGRKKPVLKDGTLPKGEIKGVVTELLARGRDVEARALSYAVGGISRETLLDTESE